MLSMQRDKKKIPRQIFWRESILVVHFIFIFHDVARWTRQWWAVHSEEYWQSVQFSSSVGLTLCDAMDYSMPGFLVHHQLLKLAQTHVHWMGDAIQPLFSPSPPAFNLPQHQDIFQWVSSLYQVAKALELQLQHQSFQWIFRTDFL